MIAFFVLFVQCTVEILEQQTLDFNIEQYNERDI